MKRNVYTDGNGSTLIEVEGLGQYVPAHEFIELQTERNQLAAQVEQLNHLVEANEMVLKQYTVYEWREIGETDWTICDEERFEYCQLSPEHDTRKRILNISEIKAQAYKQGFEACIDAAIDLDYIENDAYQCNQIRQQAKAGE